MYQNPFKRLLALFPDKPLQVGEAVAYDNGVAQLEVPGGGIAFARGEVTIGEKYFFRDEVIEGPAPNLTTEVINL